MARIEAELKTDLDHNLNLKEEHVIVSGGKLTVLEGKREIDSRRLDQIEKAHVESGFGINKLLLKMKQGEELEFCYFTKARSANFGKLAEGINDYFSKGRTTKLAFQKEKTERILRVHTLFWLYAFGRKYRATLLFGLAISLIVALVNLVPPYLLSVLIDSVILAQSPSPSLFPLIIAALFGSYATAMLLSMLQSLLLNGTGFKIITDMRNKLFAHVVKLPPTFIDNMSTGRIISRLIGDAGNTQWLMVQGLPTVVTNSLTLLGIGIILFVMFPALAVYVLVPVPFVIWLIFRYNRKADTMYFRNWRRSADMTSAISDTVPNYAIVKAASKERAESEKFQATTGKYFSSQMDLTKLNLNWQIIGFSTSLATLMIWWVGGHLVIGGVLQLGVVTAFIAYLSMFYGPINNLGDTIPFVLQSITSGQRLREILDQEVPALKHRAQHMEKPKGDIKFSNVAFEYTHPFPTIKGVNIKIKHGSKAVLVGKSGSGKTTLAKLLLRMYELNDGKITIGGKDIAKFGLDYLRHGIAYVPQEAVLFDESVAYNVGYYSPTEPDPLEIMLVCADASIHNEVMRMPLRYDTTIGERGYALSGGQRQRLSIARGMLTDPNIVVLDEVTSNLDAINASEVEGTMSHFTKHRTSISITHDAKEIMGADYVVVMDNGMVIEQGAPKELLKKKGKLSKLMRTKAHRSKREFERPSTNKVARFIASASHIKVSKGSRPSLINVSYKHSDFKDLMPTLPFPITHPNIVVFNDKEGKPMLLTNDTQKLPGEQYEILNATLNVTNFKLKILQITKVTINGDGIDWFVKTDRGKKKVTTGYRRSIRDLGRKFVLQDYEGSVFEADRGDLDERSNMLIDNAI